MRKIRQEVVCVAYRIEYGQTMIKTQFCEKAGRSGKRLKVFVVIAIILATLYFAKSESVQEILIPGNTQVTKQALSELTDDLREGEDVKSAITAFCREIIDHADVS